MMFTVYNQIILQKMEHSASQKRVVLLVVMAALFAGSAWSDDCTNEGPCKAKCGGSSFDLTKLLNGKSVIHAGNYNNYIISINYHDSIEVYQIRMVTTRTLSPVVGGKSVERNRTQWSVPCMYCFM